MAEDIAYEYELPGGSHWSFRIRKGMTMRLTDVNGQGNLAMLLHNPENLLERYNAPDTLKCQHTFKLSKGNCLYSDMGRIFCSIVEDRCGWHETVCGNLHASHIEDRWGNESYAQSANERTQNGYDSFLVELAKYGLTRRDMAANVNFFSRVEVDDKGQLSLLEGNKAGDFVELRFEMDTLVLMHSCPHPLNDADSYPFAPILVQLSQAEPVAPDDFCLNFRPENKRGFENNRIYHLAAK
jgi:uncharacterized protein